MPVISPTKSNLPTTASDSRSGLFWAIPLLLVGISIWSYSTDGILFDLLRQDTDAEWKVERLRTFFESFGMFAPVAYFVFVTIEVVVAPIPGLMLYAPGGMIFGATLGGLISLAGNVAGAGIACSVTRRLGSNWLSRLFAAESLESAQRSIEKGGGWLIFLLRVNPLTSSDLVSYAAGFTRIPIWKVMTATLFGMAPLCFAQAWLAENLLSAFPQLVYPLLAACAVYVVVVVVVLRRLGVRKNETSAVLDENNA